MVTLGIIGAENSHSWKIAELCNIGKKVPMRATCIWGETPALAKTAAAQGAVPRIVSNWRDLAGRVNGVMIAHRDGEYHYVPAKYFIERGVPVFVDKPLTTNLAAAEELLRLAEKGGAPVCSFSAVPLQASFRRFVKKLGDRKRVQILNLSGPANVMDPNGGLFFYGIHQVEAMVEIMGIEAERAILSRNGANAVGTVLFSGGRIATMNCVAGEAEFHWRACMENGEVAVAGLRFDRDPYLSSAKEICRFIRDGVNPLTAPRMLAPIAILEALRASSQTGRMQTIGGQGLHWERLHLAADRA